MNNPKQPSPLNPLTEKELLIHAYMKNGGQMFFIRNLDTYRDGGTIVIETSVPKIQFFIHHINSTLHSAYPPTNQNRIDDKEIIAFFLHRLDRYKDHLTHNLTKISEIQKFLHP